MSARLLTAALVLLVPGAAYAAGDTGHALRLLVYACINFTIFVGLIVYFLRRPTQEFVQARYKEITRDLERVKAERAELQGQLDEAHSRVQALDAEAAELKQSIVRQATDEAARKVADAEALAKSMAAAAAARAENMEREARLRLVDRAVAMLTAETGGKLDRQVDAGANERLSKRYVPAMEANR